MALKLSEQLQKAKAIYIILLQRCPDTDTNKKRIQY